MSELEPLDPTLRALFEEESTAYTASSEDRDAVLRRIELAAVLTPVALRGAKAPSATTKLGLPAHAKTIGIAVLSFLAGLGVGEARHFHAGARAPLAQAPTHATEAAQPPPPATPEPLPATPSPPSVVTSTSKLVAPPSHATMGGAGATDLAQERALIDTARSALARGRGADALAPLDEHAKRFPRGRLTEEREALAVQALMIAGDHTGASARADRFRARFPESIFDAVVERALNGAGEQK
jgi:hypothetical protein